MSIQNQIDRLAGAKTTIGNYLQQNGVAVPSGATLDEMALQLADVIEKQNKITAAGILKGDGKGGVSAATPGTDYLAEAPVTSVNGQTGEAKTNWYFNVTGSVVSPATTQTAAQIVAAQKAGFAPICSATFSDFQGLPATLPALLISSMICVFGGIGSTGGNAFYLIVMIDAVGNLTAKTDDVATKSDIPTIPTELKIPIRSTSRSEMRRRPTMEARRKPWKSRMAAVRTNRSALPARLLVNFRKCRR